MYKSATHKCIELVIIPVEVPPLKFGKYVFINRCAASH